MLQDLLTERRDAAATRFDEKTRAVMANATKQLEIESYAEKAAKEGFQLPNIELLNHKEEIVKLYDIINKKPTIVSFFRGTWCPYCNLELAEYTKLLSREKDVQLVAISPEKPDITDEVVPISEIPYTILCDLGNKLGKALNLVFTLPDDLQVVYKGFGINLEKSQGNEAAQLPIPATYIIDRDAKIVKAWINVNYTYRAEPSEVIAAYKAL